MLCFRKLRLCLLILAIHPAIAQTSLPLKPNDSIFNIMTSEIASDQGMTAEALVQVLTDWNKYPTFYKSDQNYIFHYDDPFFGDVPMRLYVPKNYSPTKKYPLLLILHGAVRLSSFARANINPLDSSVRNGSTTTISFSITSRIRGTSSCVLLPMCKGNLTGS